VQVALGMSFSLVLLQTGELYACGDNSRGQLGSEAPPYYFSELLKF
jgi:alpha-tubulin suppressor-like RCC1 family protein